MARRHKNVGGGTWYNAASSNVAKEAEERKHGGRTAKHRMDKRASGGRVGADKHPFSSAHKKGG